MANDEVSALKSRVDTLERQVHGLGHALLQDGNLHASGEERIHSLLKDGIKKFFNWSRPDRQVEDAPGDKKISGEMAKLLKELGLDSADKLAALAGLIKSTPGEVTQAPDAAGDLKKQA